ncbi:MAG: hypothetical protein KDA16_04395 [Phycisphaerales bacterium]|nr:hypothetical protein [Phycisphaerales bacterium]
MSAPTSPQTPPLAEPIVRTTMPPGWDARLRNFKIDRRARIFRSQLGLPDDKPVIMTGHQPVIWHAGILAKYLAADALAHRFKCAQARLLIDHADDDPFAFRVPMLDDQGLTAERIINLASNHTRGQPVRSRAASIPGPLPDIAFALQSVNEGAQRIRDTLAAHADAASAAQQLAHALDDLIAPFASDTPSFAVMATALAQTDLYTQLVQRMLEDPRAMAESYNNAVARYPEARVAPLDITPDRIELPLWHLSPDGRPPHARTTIYSDNMPNREHTTAKALFMTGILRLAGCDLFIHGTGGLVYDRITEHWFRNWLGFSDQSTGGVAPMIGLTADLMLPLPHADYTPASAARAHWIAHSATHNPALIDEAAHARRKHGLLSKIDAAPRDSTERRALYSQLHELLAEHRASHAGALAELNADSARAESLITAGDLARDRTWAFPLHSDRSLVRLRDSVRDQLAAAHGSDA